MAEPKVTLTFERRSYPAESLWVAVVGDWIAAGGSPLEAVTVLAESLARDLSVLRRGLAESHGRLD